MPKPILQLSLLGLLTLLSFYTFSQCVNYSTYGTNNGTLTFDGNEAVYETIGITEQDYYTVNVSCGYAYSFDFCANGGSSGSLYPDITLLDGANVLAFDMWDGTCANVTWAATFTGSIVLYIADDWDGCDTYSTSYSGTMAYNEVAVGSNSSFTLTATGCTTASSTITGDTGGAFSFNPAPGDGASIDSGSGTITNGTAGSSYTVQYDLGCGNSSTQNVTLSNAGDASFSLNASCGGAVASVTGNQGGTFAFNPAPGDGAQVSATTGNLSNATAGTTYYIEYTVCGTSNIESVAVIDDNCFTLNGDAQYISVSGEQCIELTAASNDQTGCAWNGNQIDFNSDFSLNLDYYFGSNPNGADGTTFTFQPSSSSACGQAGAQLAGGGISNSLVIEFDTYDNDGGSSWDLSCDHIAVETDGDLIDDPSNYPANSAPYCGPVCAKSGGGNIDDGGIYNVEIAWDASLQQLDIYFDGDLRLSCTGDFVTNVFGGQNQVYWGATAATGGFNNQQYFCPSTVVVLPVELSSFTSTCNEGREIFTWVTETELNTDYFELEYTYDGIIFYPVRQIDAAGTSSVVNTYTTSVETGDIKTRYYRLKIVDIDGHTEYSELIASQHCNGTINPFIHLLNNSANGITIGLNDKGIITMVDQLGKIVYNSENQVQFCTIPKQRISTGIYYINAFSPVTGESETRKVYIQN